MLITINSEHFHNKQRGERGWRSVRASARPSESTYVLSPGTGTEHIAFGASFSCHHGGCHNETSWWSQSFVSQPPSVLSSSLTRVKGSIIQHMARNIILEFDLQPIVFGGRGRLFCYSNHPDPNAGTLRDKWITRPKMTLIDIKRASSAPELCFNDNIWL